MRKHCGIVVIAICMLSLYTKGFPVFPHQNRILYSVPDARLQGINI